MCRRRATPSTAPPPNPGLQKLAANSASSMFPSSNWSQAVGCLAASSCAWRRAERPHAGVAWRGPAPARRRGDCRAGRRGVGRRAHPASLPQPRHALWTRRGVPPPERTFQRTPACGRRKGPSLRVYRPQTRQWAWERRGVDCGASARPARGRPTHTQSRWGRGMQWLQGTRPGLNQGHAPWPPAQTRQHGRGAAPGWAPPPALTQGVHDVKQDDRLLRIARGFGMSWHGGCMEGPGAPARSSLSCHGLDPGCGEPPRTPHPGPTQHPAPTVTPLAKRRSDCHNAFGSRSCGCAPGCLAPLDAARRPESPHCPAGWGACAAK